MRFSLTGKTIYIISPEHWGKMKVSKHHYAIEFALRGNNVYFIEPPSLENKGIAVRRSSDHERLHLVSYKPVYRGKRFLPAALFNVLLFRQIKLLIKAIGQKPDVVLCFHPYLFEQLGFFKAPHTIFFAADRFFNDALPPEVFSADFSLAVSDSIFEALSFSRRKIYFIQHGLNRHFANVSKELIHNGRIIEKKFNNNVLKVGYAGNLLMGGMDRDVMKKVIQTYPDLKFIFWGQYDVEQGNLKVGLNSEITGFIDFLKSCSNVELRGIVSAETLCREMLEADLFWICWKIGAGKIWDGSNSHKLLEYLSTGKPVVSHYVSSYKNSDMLDMLPEVSNDKYLELFGKVVERVKSGEPEGTVIRRINFALSNTYEKHIERIEALINEQETA